MSVSETKVVPGWLQLRAGHNCNNKCLFCNEAGTAWRAHKVGSETPDDVRRMIFSFPGNEEILFANAEPTLCPDLPLYISWAKERGFRTIHVISNGRRFAYPGYLNKLVGCGLNFVTVSIHGHTAALHDGLTQSPGSFEQTFAGLERCSALAQSGKIRLKTSTVITSRNLPSMKSIHDMVLSTKAVQEMSFNMMMPLGIAADHASYLLSNYDDVVQVFAELCLSLSPDSLRRTSVVDLPPCVLPRLPPEVRGVFDECIYFTRKRRSQARGLVSFFADQADAGKALSELCTDVTPELLRQLQDLGLPASVQRRLRSKLEESETVTKFIRNMGSGLQIVAKSMSTATQLWSMRPSIGRHRSSELSMQHNLQPGGTDGDESKIGKLFRNSLPWDFFLCNEKCIVPSVKGPPCKRCSVKSTCKGVWKAYIRRYGYQGINPV